MPELLSKIQKYGASIRGLRANDVILVSYPKSGNTWVRFFYFNLITRLEDIGAEVDHKNLDRYMPEFGHSNLAEPWPFKTVPRVVKTHNPFWFPFSGHKAVLVIRDPRDVAVSHFAYVQSRTRSRFSGDFHAFLRDSKFGMDRWFKHYLSWLKHASLVIRYEDLLQDDVAEFRKLVDLLGIPVSDEKLTEAVEASRFKNLKKLVEDKGHARPGNVKEGFNFMRSGTSKNWESSFDEADLQLYRQLCEKYAVSIYGD